MQKLISLKNLKILVQIFLLKSKQSDIITKWILSLTQSHKTSLYCKVCTNLYTMEYPNL